VVTALSMVGSMELKSTDGLCQNWKMDLAKRSRCVREQGCHDASVAASCEASEVMNRRTRMLAVALSDLDP